MANTVLTELKAVNIMLSVIGEAPVNTLTGQSTADIIQAQAVLADVSRQVQTTGWDFNTEYDYPLTPNSDDEVVLPSNTLKVDCTSHPQLDAVQRGSRLYSRSERSYTCFTDTEYKCDLTLLMEFDQLPEAAKYYITIKAARRFGDSVLGAEATHLYTKEEEAQAKADLEENHGDTADFTIFDSQSTYQIIDRSRFGGRRYNI
jgi:hypothetical protein